MKRSLQERCAAQIRNERVLHSMARFEFDAVEKLGAMMFVNAGREANTERLKECKRILKQRAGIFSDFRGTLQFIVLVKMALADDPVAYIDEVMHIYKQLKGKRVFTSSMLAMAATTIYENCPAERRDEVVRKTGEAYARIREQHRFLTDDADLSMIALMIISGMDVDRAVSDAESLFQMMKANYRVGSDVAQSAAMVLALSDKPADQKIDEFFSLFDACKAARHATSRDKSMVIYSAFVGRDYDQAEVVEEIGELDMWLKRQKGYGMFGVGGSTRRLLAASMVLEDLQADGVAPEVGVSNAVTQAVVEELVVVLMMTIITCIMISSSISRSSH